MYHLSNDKRSKESSIWIFEALERLMLIKPFLRYWYVHSSIIELIIKADQIHIIYDSFDRMLATLNASMSGVPKIITDYKNYFIGLRVSLAVSILVYFTLSIL